MLCVSETAAHQQQQVSIIGRDVILLAAVCVIALAAVSLVCLHCLSRLTAAAWRHRRNSTRLFLLQCWNRVTGSTI